MNQQGKPRGAPPPVRRIPSHLGSKHSTLSSSATSLQSPPLSAAGRATPTVSSAPNSPPKERTRVASGKAKDAEGNINVVVRCRGRSAAEIRENAILVASAAGTRGTSVTLTNPSSTITTSSSSSLLPSVVIPTTKTYNFGERTSEGKGPLGNVFGPDADQGMLYTDVAKPILDQVLQGYNCTIFAYGQTGTGKTYTMEGDLSPYYGSFSPSAGIIPRTLYTLFEKLAEDHSEFSVRCSFVELYNEELRDLNALEFSEMQATTQPMDSRAGAGGNAQGAGGLRIYDDKAAGAGVIIHGLEETLIRNAEEGIKVLKRGSERRQIAATKCNEHSSRSHSIFTIMVHIKETSKTGGEDLLKVGKLNLVDLAGSENVGRSGAEKGRAREAGMINASLLALGRVINKLVEKQSHIPYRESKLTRLLQDSLGGRTKTTIIATISPVNFEETISTLDYALRAKTIQNRPEINQRMTKGALLGQYATEIERLKVDLLAAREKNGIYFSSTSWAELSAEQEARRLQLEEAKRQIDINDSQLQTTRAQFEMNLRLLGTREEELRKIGDEVARKSTELVAMAKELVETQEELQGETVLREAFESSRTGWKGAAGEAFQDVEGLRAKLARKADVESSNLAIITTASSTFATMTDELVEQLSSFRIAQDEFAEDVKARMLEFSEREAQNLAASYELVGTRLAHLETASQAILRTSHSIDDQGQVFAQLVETVREELLESVTHLAARSQDQQKAQSDAILAGLAAHSSQMLATIEALVVPVRDLRAERLSALDQDAIRLRLLQEEDRQALEDENVRLKEVVRQLGESLEQQREATKREDAEVLALLAAKLQARSSTHLRSLEETFATVRRNVEEVSAHNSKGVDSRRGHLGILEKSNADAQAALECQARSVEEIALHQREALGSTMQNVQQNVETYRSTVHASAQAQGRVVEQAVSRFVEAGATFRSDASTSHTAFDATFAELVNDTCSTYTTCQQESTKTGEDIEATTTCVVDAVDSHWMHGGRFVNSSTRHLEDLRADMKTYLETDVSADVPTGTTPRKREWPKDRLLPVVDLDGDRVGVRELLLQAKHGRRPVEVAPTQLVEEPTSPTDDVVFSLPMERPLLPLGSIKVLGSVDTNSLRSSRSRSAKGSK